jgi:hypothetical protein
VKRDWSKALFFARYVFPALLVVAGFVAIVSEPHGTTLEGGLVLIGAGMAAFLFAFLARVSMSGDTWRDKEEAARAYFDEHGRWPDDQA